jgi:hypothetical protein
MNRQIGAKILFFSFAFAVACFGVKTVFPFPPSARGDLKNKTLSHQSGHLPNSEWEGIKIPAAAGGHIVVQKSFVPLYLSQATDFYKLFSLENLQIKKSSLLIKDYLSHIYPSHNFW